MGLKLKVWISQNVAKRACDPCIGLKLDNAVSSSTMMDNACDPCID